MGDDASNFSVTVAPSAANKKLSWNNTFARFMSAISVDFAGKCLNVQPT